MNKYDWYKCVIFFLVFLRVRVIVFLMLWEVFVIIDIGVLISFGDFVIVVVVFVVVIFVWEVI